MDIRTTKPRRRRLLTVALLGATLVSGTAFACLCTKGTILVKKFYDANANGVHDANEVRLSNWPMTLGSSSLSATRSSRAFRPARATG